MRKPKTQMVVIFKTQAELEKVRRAAKAEELSMNAFARRILLRAITEQSQPITVAS